MISLKHHARSMARGRIEPLRPISAPTPRQRDYIHIADVEPPIRISIADIKAAVCTYFEVTAIDLESSRRPKDITLARHIAIYLCRKMTTRSLPEIGRKFGGRDHSTVIYAIHRVEELLLKPGNKTVSDLMALQELLA